MILTVFRSRLNDEFKEDYDLHVRRTSELAERCAGFIGHKMFVAEDGERVTLVEFEDMESQRAWSLSSEHKAAAIAGRRGLYAEYRIQICTVNRDASFPPRPSPGKPISAPATASAVTAPARHVEDVGLVSEA